jgi:hypothetical protein
VTGGDPLRLKSRLFQLSTDSLRSCCLLRRRENMESQYGGVSWTRRQTMYYVVKASVAPSQGANASHGFELSVWLVLLCAIRKSVLMKPKREKRSSEGGINTPATWERPTTVQPRGRFCFHRFLSRFDFTTSLGTSFQPSLQHTAARSDHHGCPSPSRTRHSQTNLD